MSEKRKVEEIRQDYTNLCVKAGHLNYQIKTLQQDLEAVYSTLRDLNLEAASAQKAEDEAKAAESEKSNA